MNAPATPLQHREATPGFLAAAGATSRALRHVRTYFNKIIIWRTYMGNSTGSMFYAAVALITIYLVGASIYQVYLWIKKSKDTRRTNHQGKE